MTRSSISTHMQSVFWVHLSLFLACCLSCIHLGFYAGLQINFLYAALYFWTLLHPDSVKLLGIILLGLLHDSVLDVPLGLSVAEMWLIWGLTLVNRKILLGRGSLWIWFGFFITFFSVTLLHLGYTLFIVKKSLFLDGRTLNGMITVLLFPLMVRCLMPLYRRIRNTL